MIILTINNSYSKIEGLSAAQSADLRGLLSYTTGSYHTTFGPKKVSLLGRQGEFPTGVLHRVCSYLTESGISYQELDRRILPGGVVPHLEYRADASLYRSQLDACLSAFVHDRGVIAMPTGSGKSRVIKELTRIYGLQTLVVVPSIEIKKQMEETLRGLPRVRVENIDSKHLKQYTQFDVLIIDEAHHVAAKTYVRLNRAAWKNAYYRFFLTATPFRNNTEETLLFESIAGQVVYNLTYTSAVNNKYVVPVEAYYYQLAKQKTDAYTYPQVYKELIINNTPRNVLIANLLAKLYYQKKATLCLVKEVAHGKILQELTGLPFITGEDDDSRKYIHQFNSGGLRAVIATTSMMGEGIDTKPCEFVIIAGLGKAKSQFMQAVGRAVRTYPDKESAKVIIFRDASHRFLLRHFNAQCAILREEYGAKAIKLDID